MASLAIAAPVVDILFPNVPPDADEFEVEALGREVLEQVERREAVAALVQGDFTLTYFLVRELTARGIPCYAATTPRIAETEKVSQFRFTRFRKYL